MHDEAADLMKTLTWMLEVIRTNKPKVLRRIAESYAEAQEHVSFIPLEDGSARPRIVACFQHWNVYLAKDDVGGAGWVLAALQERIAEKNLTGWQELQTVADHAVAMLPTPQRAVH